jgi:hypothetical protein
MFKKILNKIFGKTKPETKTMLDEIYINDQRKNKTSLNSIKVDGENDPAMTAILNAAFNSDKPVIGNLEKDGSFTIKDFKN